MRKFMALVLVCFIISHHPLKAQYYYYNNKYYDGPIVFEIGATGGVMNSLTDLGGKAGIGKNFIKDLRWKTARPSYGVYVGATYNDVITARLEATFGQVVGYDSILKSVAASTMGRYERNLSFKSKISEFSLGIEVHPLFFKTYDDEPPRLSPYVMGGIGYFSFDPQAQLNGQWYSLHPLRLEGQGFAEYPDRKPYELSQVNFLAGLGLRYELNSLLRVRLEVVHRILKTDYLDDVSTGYIDASLFYNYLPANQAAIAQKLYYRRPELLPMDALPFDEQRGDVTDNDSYFTIQFKIGMTLGRSRR
jgi:hypothetical protein